MSALSRLVLRAQADSALSDQVLPKFNPSPLLIDILRALQFSHTIQQHAKVCWRCTFIAFVSGIATTKLRPQGWRVSRSESALQFRG